MSKSALREVEIRLQNLLENHSRRARGNGCFAIVMFINYYYCYDKIGFKLVNLYKKPRVPTPALQLQIYDFFFNITHVPNNEINWLKGATSME